MISEALEPVKKQVLKTVRLTDSAPPPSPIVSTFRGDVFPNLGAAASSTHAGGWNEPRCPAKTPAFNLRPSLAQTAAHWWRTPECRF